MINLCDESDELLRGVDEVEEMHMINIVQGVKNQRGNFGMPYHEKVSFKLLIDTFHVQKSSYKRIITSQCKLTKI
jgi:hypothetical protein